MTDENTPALAQAYYQLRDLLRSEETDVQLPEYVDMDDAIEFTGYEVVQASSTDELAIWEVKHTIESTDESENRNDTFLVHLLFGHAPAGPRANVEVGVADSIEEKRKID